MAACGACAEEKEEKVDRPKRLFNYKPSGVKSPDYVPIPESKYNNLEEYVGNARKGMSEMLESFCKAPWAHEAMEKTVTTELVVKKGLISDADITVYMHRPKALPKKGCAAMIFVHGGGTISGTGRQHMPLYTAMAVDYGVVGFTVEYRLAPEHGNKGCTDVYAALKYVFSNAEKLGIDKTRIGMDSDSAGTHHVFNACNLMVQKGDTGMCRMIISNIGMFTSVLRFTPEKHLKGEEAILAPQLDMMYKCMFGDKYKERIENKDPMLFPELVEEDKLKHYPPVVFLSAEFCFAHKGNMMISQRLEKVGKLLEFRLIRGLGHLYGLSNDNEVQAATKDRKTCVDVYLKN